MDHVRHMFLKKHSYVFQKHSYVFHKHMEKNIWNRVKVKRRVQCILLVSFSTCNDPFWTNRSGQTVQTQIRLLLEEQYDQGLHCLLFHLHLFH